MLLDEHLPRRLRMHFEPGVEVTTVTQRGWSGKKNGVLIRDSESEFDVLITMDQGIPHQQNLASTSLALVVLQAKSNRLLDLLPLMPLINEARCPSSRDRWFDYRAEPHRAVIGLSGR